jgi:hypothetical protein
MFFDDRRRDRQTQIRYPRVSALVVKKGSPICGPGHLRQSLFPGPPRRTMIRCADPGRVAAETRDRPRLRSGSDSRALTMTLMNTCSSCCTLPLTVGRVCRQVQVEVHRCACGYGLRAASPRPAESCRCRPASSMCPAILLAKVLQVIDDLPDAFGILANVAHAARNRSLAPAQSSGRRAEKPPCSCSYSLRIGNASCQIRASSEAFARMA